MIVNPASIALLLFFAAPTYAAPNSMKVKTCDNNGKKCSVDVGGFKLDRPKGDVSQIDLGPGRSYACNSNGKPSGGGATFHAECTSSKGNGKGKGKGGAMNVITRGKNSQGQDRMFGSVNVDGEICMIHPDATGEETVVVCTPEDEFPDEDDVHAAEEIGPVSKGDRFRKLVTDPVYELKQETNVSLRGHSRHSGSVSHQRRGLVDDLGGNLDTMVLWTAQAECQSAGLGSGCTLTQATEDNMRGIIDLAVAETNTAYELSGIFTELRLVHAYREDSYTEPGGGTSFSDALSKLTSKTDGHMDSVHANRNTYGADIVSFLIHDPASCGLGHIGPGLEKMFSITSWSCATGYYSFGHEIGHNMGCWHDRGQMGQCTSSDYHYGYRDSQARFRSILAYNCGAGQCDNNAGGGCPRVQRFSNPTYQYNGSPIGIANASDNARKINDVRAIIAAYKPVTPDCSVDTDCDDSDPCTTNVCNGVCVYKPITCDDGNACTADSCSGGSCVNTAISCDDGNSCTNDSCDMFGGCSNTIIPNCCGNFICEAGENTDTCFKDCAVGPFTITTTKCNSCSIQNGNMFDVEAKSADIAVTSLKMHIYVGAVAEVWTRPGTHEGFSNSLTGWTKVAEHDFSGVGAFTMNEIPKSSFTQTVQIPAGSKQAFYVTLTSAGTVLYNSGVGSTTAIVAEDENMRIYEGPYKAYKFGGQGSPRVWNGEMVYMKDGTATTLAPTPSATPHPTPPPAPVIAKSTNSPTDEQTKAPTPLPTDSPTPDPSKSPTPAPVTAEPTNFPTRPLTDEPTPGPVFVPEVVNLVQDTNSATIIKAAYFEVLGGDAWAKITNLKIITYGTRSLEVYYKYGSASPYEATPCAWKKVAETPSSWNPGNWKRVWPSWVNGFEPVVLPPNEKVSFYLVNTGISYGILAKSHSNSNRYLSPWMKLDATSPVGAITMSNGRGGYADQRFNPNPTSSSGYGIWGGLQFETMQPGSTEAPTTAPTEPTTPGSIESSLTGTSTERIHGLQFDVENLGSDDIIVKKLSVLMADAGTHHLEVWYRVGSYKGSGSGCNNWNNWCNAWTKLTGTNVYSSGSGSFTATPKFIAIAKAGTTTSFAVVSPNSRLLSQTASAYDVVNNGLLRINLATPIDDYYGNNVQTIHALSTSELLFEGTIDYEIAHSECAVNSQASWVVLNPIGGDVMESGDEDAVGDVPGGEVEEVVHETIGELEEEE